MNELGNFSFKKKNCENGTLKKPQDFPFFKLSIFVGLPSQSMGEDLTSNPNKKKEQLALMWCPVSMGTGLGVCYVTCFHHLIWNCSKGKKKTWFNSTSRHMGVYKNRGLGPPNHPFVHRVFHYFHHPFLDFSPLFLEPYHIISYKKSTLGGHLRGPDLRESQGFYLSRHPS